MFNDGNTLKLFEWMSRKLEKNFTAYDLVLRVFGMREDWDAAKRMIGEVNGDLDSEMYFQVFNTLIYACSKHVANILYFYSPAGVGFSYSNTSSDLLNNGDKMTGNTYFTFWRLPSILLKWLDHFPQFKGRDFSITGESHGGSKCRNMPGHYVPQLSQSIVRYNQATGDKTINLKGYMVWIFFPELTMVHGHLEQIKMLICMSNADGKSSN
ncbi:hypothetical protein Patl1_25862 [Pistacia atlantica]|uniref:Uncharacterized protein n=1 Tax=Pistacia atlantica TaxID=434234 RepID=A0ACC1B2Z7_9ROSI|nr:hypothetical protein Patl1_25862 [Pistacia atlantica]